MKNLLFTLGLGVSALAFANTSPEAEISYSGAAVNDTVVLSYDQMKDIFEERTIPKTCHRREQYGSHTECRDYVENNCYQHGYPRCYGHGDERRCETDYRTICEPVHRRVCNEVPDYRDVAYDCSTTEKVKVGEELDYTVQANVNVEIAASNTTEAARIGLNLANETLFSTVIEPLSNVVFVGKSELISSTKSEKSLAQEYTLKLDAYSVPELLSPVTEVPAIDAVAKDQIITATVGKITHPQFTEITVTLVRLKGDGQAFDKSLGSIKLKEGQYQIEDLGEMSHVLIDTKALNLSEDIAVGSQLKASLIVRLAKEKFSAKHALNPDALERRRTSQRAEAMVSFE